MSPEVRHRRPGLADITTKGTGSQGRVSISKLTPTLHRSKETTEHPWMMCVFTHTHSALIKRAVVTVLANLV